MPIEINMARQIKQAWRNKKAQSVLEYAVIIFCLVVGLVAMSKYIRRSMQGKLREAADELGQQYDPEKTRGSYTSISDASIRDWTKTQTEQNLIIDLDEDNVLEDVVFGKTENRTTFYATGTQTGGEDIN